jgi:hypothetical protein
MARWVVLATSIFVFFSEDLSELPASEQGKIPVKIRFVYS